MIKNNYNYFLTSFLVHPFIIVFSNAFPFALISVKPPFVGICYFDFISVE